MFNDALALSLVTRKYSLGFQISSNADMHLICFDTQSSVVRNTCPVYTQNWLSCMFRFVIYEL